MAGVPRSICGWQQSMFYLSILLCLVFKLAASVNIEQLSDSNWQSFVQSHAATLLKVTAPWCERSVDLAPQFQIAVDEASACHADLVDAIDLAIAEIDGTKSQSVVAELGVVGFPVIAIVSNKGKSVKKYNGDRSNRSIASWVLHSLPTAAAVKQLKSTDAVARWAEVAPTLFVVADQTENKSLLSAVEAAAASLSSTAVFVSVPIDNQLDKSSTATDSDLATDSNSASDSKSDDSKSGLRVYRQAEGLAAALSSSEAAADKSSVEVFVRREIVPLVARITGDNYKVYLNENGYNAQPVVWFIGTTDEFNSIESKLQAVAKSFRSAADVKVLFAWLSVESHKDHAWTSLSVAASPALVFQSLDHQIYEFPQSVLDAEAPAIAQFIQSGLAGQPTTAPKRRSQLPLPNPHTRIAAASPSTPSLHVTTMVGNELENQVYGDGRDALVAVLAPFGINNNQIEEALDAYGETIYSKSEELQQNLKLLKIDGTQNDVQNFKGFEIARYPSLFYVRKSKSNIPIRYSCPATVEAISMFVERAFNDELVPARP